MISTQHQWNGVVVAVFQMDKGDKIERHKHVHEHSTAVTRGQTKVSVWYPDGLVDFAMMPNGETARMPPEIEHEIEATEDGTIVVNMHTAVPPASQGIDGGIAFDD
jgi:quercetin dioxygenase-like cupin family protein